MKLPFTQGGHQLRRWADFADAAFIGQWALTVQTAHDLTTGRSMFPIFERILDDKGGVICGMALRALAPIASGDELTIAYSARMGVQPAPLAASEPSSHQRMGLQPAPLAASEPSSHQPPSVLRGAGAEP